MNHELSPNSLRVLCNIRDGKRVVDSDVKEACTEALAVVQEMTKRARWKSRAVAPRAFEPWSQQEEQCLVRRHEAGSDVFAIAAELERSPNAVRIRLRSLDYKPRDTAA
jgi:hypothetical protein